MPHGGVESGRAEAAAPEHHHEQHQQQRVDHQEDRRELPERLSERVGDAVSVEGLVDHQGVFDAQRLQERERQGRVVASMEVVVVEGIRIGDDDRARVGAHHDRALRVVQEHLVISADAGEDL